MKWEQDLIKDIRTNTEFDDQDGGVEHPLEYRSWYRGEFTSENRMMLHDIFMQVRDNCPAILEIGVCRNEGDSSTWTFLKNKKPETIYIGIDLEDKSFLNDPANNVYTIRASSSDIDANMELIKSLGVTEFGFIFIDGWHSINQVLTDWEYTKSLASDGVVGFHDTTVHPGPAAFVKALNKDLWNVEENLCPEDHGIGFAWQK
jgi:hypothetical protein